MLRSKSTSDYNEQVKVVDGWLSTQEYIADTSLWFNTSLTEEREILKEEGNKVRDKSHKLISKISEQGWNTSDFISWTIMFAKFYEIVGHLIAQNHSVYQKEAKYDKIESLIQEIKDFGVNMNRQTIVERLKELEKLKHQYNKNKISYERAITKTEEAIRKSKDAKKDPKLAYDLTSKELLDEKANESLKKLDLKKENLKNWIENLNNSKTLWNDMMNKLKEQTKWGVGEYISLLLNAP